SFLVTAAGIVFSFLVLAGVTIGLKQLGLAVGWGVQFQQPVFLGLLILLLTFFAANMWGLFEIHLPRFLADNLAGPYHPKLAGDFATGAFATLLATPCTAPFLGTAVGFALASGPHEIVIIFTALGLGMSLPYIAVALVPRIATALPRPGTWMVRVRHVLGWALALTALWLVWVLAAQISPRGAAVVGLCMAAIIGLFSLNRIRRRGYIAFGIASFALLAFANTLMGSVDPKPAAIDPAWERFDEHEIAGYVEKGKTVFVDITADWCLTCKANKKFVLMRDEVKARLFQPNVVAMEADWTNPDPQIGAYLQKHGRYGIPFNIVFGPAAPQGIVLPELLTPSLVLDALDRAEKLPQP
ncbi:MAG: protein-disulfide reductase DsbD family protein, partial [Bdellovibrionales bacterium]